jgi:hypothetical protein
MGSPVHGGEEVTRTKEGSESMKCPNPNIDCKQCKKPCDLYKLLLALKGEKEAQPSREKAKPT